MNVIEKMLTTEPYAKVRKILEIKKTLSELQDVELDFNDKNVVHTYKKIIIDNLNAITKDIPYILDNNNLYIKNTGWKDRIVSTEPITVPSYRDNRWNFGLDTTYGTASSAVTVQTNRELEAIFGDVERRSGSISVNDLSNDVIASFNDSRIDRQLDAIATTSRRNTAQN